jgi:diguanylate cyclase (GGDEF)-like protein
MVMIVSGLLCIILGTYLELKSRMKTQKQLEFAMSHDPLTGCLSRQAAILQLHENPDLTDHPYSIILLDLDDFQEINETYGHDNGDLLLRTAAYELQALAAERKAMLCRYGGDEFMFVFDRPIQPEDDPVIDRILNVFRRGRKVGFDTIHLYGSAGIANAACRTSPSDLILHSELALQRSKHNGKNIVTLYTDDLLKAEQQREQTRSSVLDAIEHDGLYMLYQPQVDAQDGTLVGFEALVRLKNREIGPGVFIPMAEENGWIREIGRRTTEMTIRQIAQWRKAGLAVPPVSINYSAGQLNDTAYVGYLLSLLKEYDVPGCLIRLEITERLAMRDDEDVRALFREMQAAGIQFHMDDFGTGYSSFSYLSYVPVDTVKIDKSLVDAYLNPENETIFHDIVSMVHDMHKKTIVEGVETQQQYLKLKSFGCDMIQGYYFGRPLKAEQAAEDIRKKNLMPER